MTGKISPHLESIDLLQRAMRIWPDKQSAAFGQMDNALEAMEAEYRTVGRPEHNTKARKERRDEDLPHHWHRQKKEISK